MTVIKYVQRLKSLITFHSFKRFKFRFRSKSELIIQKLPYRVITVCVSTKCLLVIMVALLLYGDTQRSPQFRNKKRHSEIEIAPTACACAMCVSVIKQGASTHKVPCGPLIFDLNVTSLIVLLVTRWFNRCLLILRIETFLCDTMTYFTTWEDFAKAAEMLYVNDPMKVLQTAERGPYMRNADCI